MTTLNKAVYKAAQRYRVIHEALKELVETRQGDTHGVTLAQFLQALERLHLEMYSDMIELNADTHAQINNTVILARIINGEAGRGL